jgi:hypothetical protein
MEENCIALIGVQSTPGFIGNVELGEHTTPVEE